MGREEIMRGETQDTSGHNEKILVSIRLRPLNEKENTRNDISEWECIDNTTIICKHNLTERSMFPSAYTFDRVFGCDCPTKQVYEEGAKEVAVSALGGINASIFAYGQTSSGKTYTMSGITKYAIADIFEYMEKRKDREFVLKFSAMEIYNEAVRDLLSSDSTPLRLLDDPERGTVVERLTEEALRDRSHLEELLSICEAQRQIGETSLNETSSRSHQILRLTIESSAQKSSSLAANLNFVDLAGSERASQTLSAGARLKEGCHINRSLLTLGTVIRKLSKGRTGHIPYRDSKLTRILQNSLGGNARTAIICTMSPARSHVEQSRNTLFFASCAKQVTTNAQVNLVVSDKILVRQLQRELARMENELRNLESGSITSDSAALLREKEQLMEKEQLIEKMDKQIKELTWQRDMAQSRVENLLRSVGEDRLSKTDEYAENGPSNIANPPRLDAEFGSCNGAKDLDTPTIIDSDKPSLELPENSEDNFLLDDSTPKFGGPDPCQGWEEIAGRGTREEAEAICEEVPCVEKEESIVRTKAEVDVLSSTSTEKEEKLSLTWETKETESSPQKEDKESSRNDIDDTYDALKEKVKEMQKTIHYLVNLQCQEQSPFSETYSPSCGSFKLTRSRSCRESLINIPSPLWLEKVEQKGNTSPVVYEKDHIRRRTGSSSKLPELKYTASTGPFSRKASQTSLSSMEEESTISTFSMDAHSNKESYAENTPDMHDVIPGPNGMASFLLEGAQNKEEPAIETINHIDHFFAAQNEKTKLQPENAQSIGESGVENIINRDHFVARLNDMCQPQSDKQSSDDSCHKSANEEAAAPETNESQESINGIGLETVQCALKTHTDWASEFERQRGEIMALWAICSVPLVHRTYFYLLFKGDPSDSVYMEVELRRLSFLKSTFSQGSNASRRDSVKALNRERDMLAKQIPKKFSRKEREFLYKKWGINLNTKQRSLQLANCLWTDTNDINHVNESANLVSKLVGLVEASQTPKEMFGLSFLPKSPSWRTFSWKNNLPSLV